MGVGACPDAKFYTSIYIVFLILPSQKFGTKELVTPIFLSKLVSCLYRYILHNYYKKAIKSLRGPANCDPDQYPEILILLNQFRKTLYTKLIKTDHFEITNYFIHLVYILQYEIIFNCTNTHKN